MFRIDKDGAVANLPAPAALGSPGYFTEGNPATGTPATQVTADWLNAVQEELVSVIAAAGIALDKTNRAQLLAAIRALTSKVSYAWIGDVKAPGTPGGDFVSGAWRTRDLNTIRDDADGLVAAGLLSLASNQFTLGAGTWHIRAEATASNVDGHQCRLFNVTDGAAVRDGTSQNAVSPGTDAVTSVSVVSAIVTLAAPKTFRLEHRCATTQNTSGFGTAVNMGNEEIYSVVHLWKLK